MYLPALFIYKDIKHCSFKDSLIAKYTPTPDFQQAFLHQESGNYVMKYSSGQALTMLPFFLAAHAYCLQTHLYPADGFSLPYQFGIGAGMFLYALIGLFFLRKILLYYFKDTTVAVVLLCYGFGTNYLNWSSIDQGMTHSTLFTIYCLLIYSTIHFYRKKTLGSSIAIGSLVGLATLIRPTDLISILIPLLWGVASLPNFKKRVRSVVQSYHFLLIFLCAAAVYSIQLFYWKSVSGHWLVYSYEKQGFSWLHPHIYDYTLSYWSGWLRYCPMMLIPMVGMLYYAKKGPSKVAVLTLILLDFYVVTAWDIWDYGGTGGRAMVQMYPVLAFPFCLAVERLLQTKWTAALFAVVAVLFTYLNIWFIYQAHRGPVVVLGASKAYYWKKVGRWSNAEEDLKLLDNPSAYGQVPRQVTLVYERDFDSDTAAAIVMRDGNGLVRLNQAFQYSPISKIPYSPWFKKWVRASADIHCEFKEWDTWHQAQFVLKFMNQDEDVQSNVIKIHRLLSNGETKNIYLDAVVPEDRWDTLLVYVWNADGKQELLIDNLKVITFD